MNEIGMRAGRLLKMVEILYDHVDHPVGGEGVRPVLRTVAIRRWRGAWYAIATDGFSLCGMHLGKTDRAKEDQRASPLVLGSLLLAAVNAVYPANKWDAERDASRAVAIRWDTERLCVEDVTTRTTFEIPTWDGKYPNVRGVIPPAAEPDAAVLINMPEFFIDDPVLGDIANLHLAPGCYCYKVERGGQTWETKIDHFTFTHIAGNTVIDLDPHLLKKALSITDRSLRTSAASAKMYAFQKMRQVYITCGDDHAMFMGMQRNQ